MNNISPSATTTRATHQQRETLRWQLEQIEALCPGYTLFSDNKRFNYDLKLATGYTGTLTTKGFQAIVDFVAEDVGGTLNEFGHVDESSIINSEYGRLLRTIIYLLCFSFGTAHGVTIIGAKVGRRFKTETQELANGFVQRLVLKKEKSQRKAPKETVLQIVVRKQMGTKLLFGTIKQTIKGFFSDYCAQVAAGVERSVFKKAILSEGAGESGEDGSFLVAKSASVWEEYDRKEGIEYAQELLLEAIDQLNEDQKHVLRVLFSCDPIMYEGRQEFHTQVGAIHKMLGTSKRKAIVLAKDIVKSIQETLDVVVVKRTVKTQVPVHYSKAVLAKRTTAKAARFKMKEKEVREDFFVSSLLEQEHIEDLLSAMRWCANSTSEVIVAKLK